MYVCLFLFLQLKMKRTNNPIILPETNWTQEQQQLLELAIVKFPKSTATDRWEKVSNTIPGKTKEECLARYKHLVEIVKAQKARESVATSDELTSNRTDDDKIEEDPLNEPAELPTPSAKGGGKPRNKRKERKANMDFSSDEDD